MQDTTSEPSFRTMQGFRLTWSKYWTTTWLRRSGIQCQCFPIIAVEPHPFVSFFLLFRVFLKNARVQTTSVPNTMEFYFSKRFGVRLQLHLKWNNAMNHKWAWMRAARSHLSSKKIRKKTKKTKNHKRSHFKTVNNGHNWFSGISWSENKLSHPICFWKNHRLE